MTDKVPQEMYDGLSGAQQALVEIEEWTMYPPCWDCHSHAFCTILDTSHTCTCNPGYAGDGTKCSSKSVGCKSVEIFNYGQVVLL